MFPVDVLRLVCSYSEDIPLVVHPELWWNVAVLGNSSAEDLIDDYLSQKAGPLTLEEMKRLSLNSNAKYLPLLDLARFPILIDSICRHPSAEAMAIVRGVLAGLTPKNWMGLSGNPYAIDLLRENPAKIDYKELSDNPMAYDLLKESVVSRKLGHFPYLHILSGRHAERLFEEVPDIFPQASVYHSSKLLDVKQRLFGEDSLTASEVCSHPGW